MDQQGTAMAGHRSARSLPAYLKMVNKRRLADDGFRLLDDEGEDGTGAEIGTHIRKLGPKSS